MKVQENYWNKTLQGRVSRRRAMIASSTAAMGAAFLAACGGSDGDKDGAKSSGLVVIPEDTTGKAVVGGILKTFATNDPNGFDAIGSPTSQVWAHSTQFAYPRMFKYMTGKYPNLPSGETEGDFVESFELSPDKLSLTVKIRSAIKWDNRTPTNGRVADADDLMFTWNKYRAVNPFRAALVYDAEKAPLAPIETMTAVDPRTVRIKLNKPNLDLMPLFAAVLTSFFIQPKEADGGFDPKADIRGSGPYILESYQPSINRVWRRNPDYYVKGRPFFDKVEIPVVPEYAAQLSQFRAGNIWTSVVTQEDLIQTKRDVPKTQILQTADYEATTQCLAFGWEPNSPYRDERVRQAISMAMDKETHIDTVGNRLKFEAEGLPMKSRYYTAIQPNFEGYWLDPQGKDFGPNGKYYKFDLTEAKKLLAAAGHPNGFASDLHLNAGPGGTTAANKRNVEIAAGFLTDLGIRARMVPQNYPEPWLGQFNYGYTSFQHPGGKVPGRDGLAMVTYSSGSTPASALFNGQHKNSSAFKGSSADGNNAHLGDPEDMAKIEAIMAESDRNRQIELVKEYQRAFAKKAYLVPMPGVASQTFRLTWPVIGNYGFHTPAIGVQEVPEQQIHWWQDSSKAPLA